MSDPATGPNAGKPERSEPNAGFARILSWRGLAILGIAAAILAAVGFAMATRSSSVPREASPGSTSTTRMTTDSAAAPTVDAPSPTAATTTTIGGGSSSTTTTVATTVASVVVDEATTTTMTTTPEPVRISEEVAWYQVTGVDQGATLNVRTGPGTDYPIIDSLAAYAAGIRSTGTGSVAASGATWRQIHLANGTGWVHGGYLEVVAEQGSPLYVRSWVTEVHGYQETIDYVSVIGLNDPSAEARINRSLDDGLNEVEASWRGEAYAGGTFKLNLTDGLVDQESVSVTLSWEAVRPGTASYGFVGWHMMTFTSSHPGPVELGELIDTGPEFLALLTRSVIDEHFGGDTARFEQLNGTVVAVEDFSVAEDGIRFGWDQYSLGSRPLGSPIVVLPWDVVDIVPGGPVPGLLE